ncbi:NADH-cytochrome b5 reductase [Quillaja saponaria]|uniref:cytochrome-b5 reductase n=1 Tax=Quillaja saponaria TaxID=32244 RepID=A0AAD7QJ41_QUISA|nr:NADH-cytochrome b5 reductase [Quillaja saponaria]
MVCLPNNFGGLGLKKVSDTDFVMLVKLGWRLTSNPDDLWSKVVSNKYLKDQSFFSVKYHNSYTWKSIMKGNEVIELGAKWRIGDISKIKFLTYIWIDDLVLSDVALNPIPDELLELTVYPYLVGIAVALAALGITAAYNYFHKKPKVCLDPKNFKEFQLVQRTQLNHNTAKFRFALPTPTSVLSLSVGKHVVCRGKDWFGEEVVRPYTPITLDTDVGYFELVVKMYPKGRMSHHFREMQEGDYLSVKGPKFGMLVGGTGITPMFQLTGGIIENPKDNIIIHLIYANVTLQDILLKEELDGFASKFPSRFTVYYVLSQPPAVPFFIIILLIVIKSHFWSALYLPSLNMFINRQILRCGPPGMNKAMADHLTALGYTSKMHV